MCLISACCALFIGCKATSPDRRASRPTLPKRVCEIRWTRIDGPSNFRARQRTRVDGACGGESNWYGERYAPSKGRPLSTQSRRIAFSFLLPLLACGSEEPDSNAECRDREVRDLGFDERQPELGFSAEDVVGTKTGPWSLRGAYVVPETRADVTLELQVDSDQIQEVTFSNCAPGLLVGSTLSVDSNDGVWSFESEFTGIIPSNGALYLAREFPLTENDGDLPDTVTFEGRPVTPGGFGVSMVVGTSTSGETLFQGTASLIPFEGYRGNYGLLFESDLLFGTPSFVPEWAR